MSNFLNPPFKKRRLDTLENSSNPQKDEDKSPPDSPPNPPPNSPDPNSPPDSPPSSPDSPPNSPDSSSPNSPPSDQNDEGESEPSDGESLGSEDTPSEGDEDEYDNRDDEDEFDDTNENQDENEVREIDDLDDSDSSSDEDYDPNTYNHDPGKRSRPIIIMDLLKLLGKPPNIPPPPPPRSNSDPNLFNFDEDDSSSSDSSDDDVNYPNHKLGPILPNRLRNRPGTRIPVKRKRKTPPPPKPVKKIKIDITDQIRTLDDLINLPDKYEDKPEYQYSFDMKKMKALQEPLKELRNMVGLDNIKEQIVNQIMFLLCDLKDPDQNLHTVITGKPGTGKTSLSIILSDIYKCLGFSNGKFRVVKRSDLVGMYLGHTAAKTQRVIDSVKGGVLFIDEAYSLGNPEGRDSFSKEAIDTLNQNLSEQKTNFICIIAGYKDALEKCFFAYNPGLTRRFPFRYDIESYSSSQLQQIFLRRLQASDWTCDEVPTEFFEKLDHFFTNQGGDMEILSQMAKIAYTRRIFGKHQDAKKHLTLDDILEGFTMFTKNSEVRNRMDGSDTNPADGFYHRQIGPRAMPPPPK